MSDSFILAQYRSLFAESFKMNVEIDNEVLTEEQLNILQELEPDEVLDNFKDLLNNLIEFKRFFRKAEALESLEAESSISTPVSEDTQSFYHSFKIVNEANEELKKEIQALKEKVLCLENKLRDSETEKKRKEVRVNSGEEKGTQEQVLNKCEVLESEKKVSNEAIHNYANSENNLLSKSNRKNNMIKSVKFEYITVNNKKVTINVKPIKKKKSGTNVINSPEKLKTSHSRSNSNVFVNLKQLR